MCSSPTEMRTMSGSTPAASCCAASSWRCVVDAGWMIERARVADVGQVAHELRRLDELHARLQAALTPKASSPEAPGRPTVRICRASSACCG